MFGSNESTRGDRTARTTALRTLENALGRLQGRAHQNVSTKLNFLREVEWKLDDSQFLKELSAVYGTHMPGRDTVEKVAKQFAATTARPMP